MRSFLSGLITTAIKLTGGSPGAGKVLTSDADGNGTWQTPASGSGDVTGPSSSTDRSMAYADGTTGKLVQFSDQIRVLPLGPDDSDILRVGDDVFYTEYLGNGMRSTDALDFTSDDQVFFSAGGLLAFDADGPITFNSGPGQSIEMVDPLKVDTITEQATDAGVTIENVLVKDGQVDGRDVSADGTTLDSLNSSVYKAGGTDVAVADGGTGASTASAARTNLGAEASANKSTSTSLGASNTLFPTQNAVKAYVDAAIAAAQTAMQLPVGSIYVNRTSSTNPATLLGYGTWTQITDKMIMARGSTYTADGGAATHTHGLNDGRAHMNATGSDLLFERIGETFTANVRFAASGGTVVSNSSPHKVKLGGSTDSGSNIPPHIVAYVWERTA